MIAMFRLIHDPPRDRTLPPAARIAAREGPASLLRQHVACARIRSSKSNELHLGHRLMVQSGSGGMEIGTMTRKDTAMRPTLRATIGVALMVVLGSVVAPSLLFAAGPPANLRLQPDNGRIAIYSDPQGTQTCATIAPGAIGTLYLFAELAGESAAGIAAAEFRIQVTNPTGYIFLYSPPPASLIQVGSVFDTTPSDPDDRTGIIVAFPVCQTGPRVAMGTILILNNGGGSTDLLVERRNPTTNPAFPCPWFVQCDVPSLTGTCMGPCAVGEDGISIVAQASVNDPACADPRVCPVDCPGVPEVAISVTGPMYGCVGEPIQVGATVFYNGPTPADIDVWIEHQLVKTFAQVAPGGIAEVWHLVPMPACGSGNNAQIQFGAVARNASCPDPFGVEGFHPVFCDSRVCGINLPPDCSGAHASVEELWPHNGKLVPVSVEGVVDPNGAPLEIWITDVTSDESPGAWGTKDCPDVVFDGPNAVQLRAEADPHGNGRVYRLRFTAREPSGLGCGDWVEVCVPKNPHEPCIDDGQNFQTRFCNAILPGRGDPSDALQVIPEPGGTSSIAFGTAQASDVRLDVFDIRGRLVRTVEQASLPAGSHILRWNGRDASGRQAAAGVYLFRLRAGEQVRTVKSILIR